MRRLFLLFVVAVLAAGCGESDEDRYAAGVEPLCAEAQKRFDGVRSIADFRAEADRFQSALQKVPFTDATRESARAVIVAAHSAEEALAQIEEAADGVPQSRIRALAADVRRHSGNLADAAAAVGADGCSDVSTAAEDRLLPPS